MFRVNDRRHQQYLGTALGTTSEYIIYVGMSRLLVDGRGFDD